MNSWKLEVKEVFRDTELENWIQEQNYRSGRILDLVEAFELTKNTFSMGE